MTRQHPSMYAARRFALAAAAVWQRLADQYADDWITLVVGLARQQGYSRGYQRAHRRVTTHLAAAAALAGCGQPDPGGASLRCLAVGIRAGVLAGALGAATDVVIDWRARSRAGEAGIHQLPAGTRAAELLAAARAAVIGIRVDASDPLSPDRAHARAGPMSQPSDITREVR